MDTKVENLSKALVIVEDTTEAFSMNSFSRQLKGLVVHKFLDTQNEIEEVEEALQIRKPWYLQDGEVRGLKLQQVDLKDNSDTIHVQTKYPIPSQTPSPGLKHDPIFQDFTIGVVPGEEGVKGAAKDISEGLAATDSKRAFKGEVKGQKRVEVIEHEESKLTRDFGLPTTIDVQLEPLDFSAQAKKILHMRTDWGDEGLGASNGVEKLFDDSSKRTKNDNTDVKDLELLGHENLNELRLKLQILHNTSLSRGDKVLIEDLDERVELRMERNIRKADIDAKRFEGNLERSKKELPELRGLERLKAAMMVSQKGTAIGKGGVFQLGGVQKA